MYRRRPWLYGVLQPGWQDGALVLGGLGMRGGRQGGQWAPGDEVPGRERWWGGDLEEQARALESGNDLCIRGKERGL